MSGAANRRGSHICDSNVREILIRRCADQGRRRRPARSRHHMHRRRGGGRFSVYKSLYQLGQWGEFFLLDQPKLLDEVDEMFEGRVQMRLLLQANDFREVSVINVGVDSK